MLQGLIGSKDKNVQATIQLCSFHMLAKCRKFSVKRIENLNQELLDVQAGFRKGRGIRDQIVKFCCIIEKARELKKKSTSASLTTLKLLTV